MPIYAYKCVICDSVQEQYRSLSRRDDPTPCEECGSPTRRTYLPQLFNMNGDGASNDDITRWQFKNLDDKIR